MLAPLTCGVVMLISGVAKVGRPTATREAFMAMGVPQALRSETLVTSLPFVEIALGVLLLATWSWPLAVIGAATTALFAAYWVLVLRVLRRGEEVDCGCFGALGDDRVSGTTLARNSLLVVLAALATAFGAAGSGVVPAVRDFRPTDWWWLVLSVAVAATAVLVVGLRRPEPAVADDDLLDYERAPIPFALLEDESGTRVTLTQLAAERPQLLLFLSSHCWACESIAENVPAWMSQLGPVQVSTVFTEPLQRVPDKMRRDGVPPVVRRRAGCYRHLRPRTTLGSPPGGRRSPGRRAGHRCQRRRHVRRGDRGGAELRSGPAGAGRARARLHRRPRAQP